MSDDRATLADLGGSTDEILAELENQLVLQKEAHRVTVAAIHQLRAMKTVIETQWVELEALRQEQREKTYREDDITRRLAQLERYMTGREPDKDKIWSPGEKLD